MGIHLFQSLNLNQKFDKHLVFSTKNVVKGSANARLINNFIIHYFKY